MLRILHHGRNLRDGLLVTLASDSRANTTLQLSVMGIETLKTGTNTMSMYLIGLVKLSPIFKI